MKYIKSEKNKDKVLKFITESIAKNGYPPTVREVCQGVGFSSSVTGQKYINMLKDEGLLSGSTHQWRTLQSDAEQYKPFTGTVNPNSVTMKIQIDKKTLKVLRDYCIKNNLSANEGVKSAIRKLKCFAE